MCNFKELINLFFLYCYLLSGGFCAGAPPILRCKQCGYDESVTANTIFHGMKMPVLKAFHMIFRLTAKKKGMSTVELGTEVGVELDSLAF
jgi:hypothetical protein